MMGDAPVGANLPFFGKVPKSFVRRRMVVCDDERAPIRYPICSPRSAGLRLYIEREDFCLPDLRGVFLARSMPMRGVTKG